MLKCKFCKKRNDDGCYVELHNVPDEHINIELCESCYKNLKTGINNCLGKVSDKAINEHISMIKNTDLSKVADELQKHFD